MQFKKMDYYDLEFVNETRFEACQFLHDTRSFTLNETKEWFMRYKPYFYMIIYHGNTIGYFRLSNYMPHENSMYIGADLHKDWRGKGLGYQAYCEFIPYITGKHGLNTLYLEVLEHNIRAHNLYKKLGFIRIGQYEASIKMALPKRVWKQKS